MGTLCAPLGSLWRSLAPLGPYFGDFGIILGPSDCRKDPKRDEERCWDVVFLNSFRFNVMLLICMLLYVVCMLLFVVCVFVCMFC